MKATTINTTTLKGFNVSLKSIDNADSITIAATFAAVHAVEHRNLEPMKRLFGLGMLKLKSGALSALGKNVRTYVLFHVKGLTITDKLIQLGKAPAMRAEQVTESGFALSFADFINKEKAPVAEKPPVAITAKALAGRLDKIIEALSAGLVCPDKETALALVAQIEKIQSMTIKGAAATIAPVELDHDRNDMLASVKPTAASKAAPKKRTASK